MNPIFTIESSLSVSSPSFLDPIFLERIASAHPSVFDGIRGSLGLDVSTFPAGTCILPRMHDDCDSDVVRSKCR
ncbi:MAG: hypothetical protein D6795_13910 [Deltaproteobacteria bacterium]|nr:MAG: hypothetical protein D6795_13910 [Deltaproteobacteria bacterium]